MESQERIMLFVNELDNIKNDNLRLFASKLLLHANDYFFSVPASSSKKYHPPFAREDSGLVKHTRCVAFFAKCNAESFNFNSIDTDLLIIAAIAHDIKKQGPNDFSKHTVWEHPELAYDYVYEIQNKYPNLISFEYAQKIANAVLCHMGKWAHQAEFVKNKKQYPMPHTLFEQALQSADYIASRSELTTFAFEPTEDKQLSFLLHQSIEEFESSNIKDSGSFKIYFGKKHIGKTISEIYDIDKGWLDWVHITENFHYKDAREAVINFYVENSYVPNVF